MSSRWTAARHSTGSNAQKPSTRPGWEWGGRHEECPPWEWGSGRLLLAIEAIRRVPIVWTCTDRKRRARWPGVRKHGRQSPATSMSRVATSGDVNVIGIAHDCANVTSLRGARP